ncbi:RBP11-like subunits of RNA polymerase [Mycena indigotica]|uniref:RBP11-like subunits of RNA polymerase n=1 Tax=Mycena indigotica TaxID=2126181 RepID=A0A8H6TCG6_9AGAR|nr:RBP11-like subunits of RNA polymerase [Mycena indigotica]KAF7316265.1 RBP11-like subunits of RNA polymerase [Mycena indigotica]
MMSHDVAGEEQKSTTQPPHLLIMSTANLPQKVTIMKGAAPDLSAATYQIFDESHTIGNPLRWMLMKNPKVEFCGYSVPHPSENLIQVRIQMYDNLSSLTALIEALSNLDSLFSTIETKYVDDLNGGDYERWEEKS